MPSTIKEIKIEDRKKIKFYCPSKKARQRANRLLTKEPETIDWINSFDKGDVLWDIGACVGAFSLYAAKKKHNVLSFEPMAANYYLLNKNIKINRLDNRILAFCIAFNDTTVLDHFYIKKTGLGQAGNAFGEPLDYRGKKFNEKFKQGMLGYSIDDFMKFKPIFPNHIKIDVDGIEDKIIKGGTNTLSDERVKSILVEMNADQADYCERVGNVLKDCGLRISARKHAKRYDGSSLSMMYNYIFVREN